MTASETHAVEVAQGERFAFGENWRQFLAMLDDDRVREAKRSLEETLGPTFLAGKRMLDLGCGSGLFSLSGLLLGASVHSFDFDPASVECARVLKRRYAGDSPWTIETGSVLDRNYMESLGRFDLVYAWGVLHHTGDMWKAMEHAALPVAPGGQLVVSIYNDQGRRSARWLKVKRIYNSLPRELRTPYVLSVMGPRELRFAVSAAVRLQPGKYVRSWTDYKQGRGMSRWHDLVDWCGGYPFEVARPEQVFGFYHARGFDLRRLETRGAGLGCNEFVFERCR